MFGFSREDHRRVSRATKQVESLPGFMQGSKTPTDALANGLPMQLGVVTASSGIPPGGSGDVDIYAGTPANATGTTRSVWNFTLFDIPQDTGVHVFPANGKLYAIPEVAAPVPTGANLYQPTTSSIVVSPPADTWAKLTGYNDSGQYGVSTADASLGEITPGRNGIYYLFAHVLADLGGSGRSGIIGFSLNGGVPGNLVMGNDNSNQSSFIHASLSGQLSLLASDTIALNVQRDSSGGSITVTSVSFGLFNLN